MRYKYFKLLLCLMLLLLSGCAEIESTDPPTVSGGTREGSSFTVTSDSQTQKTTAAATEAETFQSEVSVTTVTTAAETEPSAAMTTASEKETTTTTTATTTVTTTTTARPLMTEPTVASSQAMADIIAAYPYDCSVLLCNNDGRVIYSYQPNKSFPAASLIKLPYVYYCCEQLDKGVHSLDESITYTSAWFHDGSGKIVEDGYGISYTIAELIEYSVKYSDNVAYDMLVYLFGTEGFNKMMYDWGYDVSIYPGQYYPNATASLMKTAMMKIQNKPRSGGWEAALRGLDNSEYSYVRKAIGDHSKVAAKFGYLYGTWNEACYVTGDVDYYLIILSGINGFDYDKAYIGRVAACADSIMREQYGLGEYTP